MGLFNRKSVDKYKETLSNAVDDIIEEQHEEPEIIEQGTYQPTEEDISVEYINNNILSEYNKDVLNVMDIETISDYKYQYMDKVESINILNYVNNIGNDSFKECINVKNINFTAPVKDLSLGNNTFYNCCNLENFNFKGSFSNIGENCFAHCENLRSINLVGIDTVPNNAFLFNTSLSEIVIVNVQYIKAGAFMYCKSLTDINFGSCHNLLSIDAYAFSGCNLSKITIPDTVKEIGDYVFEDNFNLTDVYFEGKSNILLGDDIFKHCDNVTIHTNNNNIIEYCKKNIIRCTS